MTVKGDPSRESNLGVEAKESRKRRREAVTVIFIGIVFLLLTWAEFHLTRTSQKLPFIHSIFFFGLVNFNIVLLLFLLFLIFRNVVKIFVERPGKWIGSALKGKLVAAFVAFSFVPTVLMFLISVFYINSSFDKWFSVKMAGVLKDALEVTNAYYTTAKNKNYHFAHLIADKVKGEARSRIEKDLPLLRNQYSVDSVEFYAGVFEKRILTQSKDESIPELPSVAMDFLQKGLAKKEASTVHHFGEGNLVRVIVPADFRTEDGSARTGAIVVSSFIPLSLITKMDDIAAVYDDFRDLNPIEYPLKSIYLTILFLMTIVIFFGATWFGFHLARQLSTPLETLAKAARRISVRDYSPVAIRSGTAEINELVGSFNQMTADLGAYQRDIIEANASLKTTLDTLDKHSRYVEVVLSNVSAGVVSISADERITTINRHAGKLLKIDHQKYIGKNVRDVLTKEHQAMLDELVAKMRQYRAHSLQREFRLSVDGESLLMQVTLTLLKDEAGRDLGMVLVFDDLTMLVHAQRAAAWREVARRIAHEIKNPLTPIKLSAQRLEKKFGATISDPAFSACTSTIIKQTDELKELVNEFSNFARLPQANPTPGNLNQVIEEALVLYQTGHKDILFELELDRRLPQFSFDAEQMKRVLTNLFENAVAAVEGLTEQGRVKISTQFDDTLGLVRLAVWDNGAGIPDDIRGRIFEPYFSTKKHGTGLGLAIVKRIVDDHNGFVRAFANEPRGTKFLVELPVVASKPESAGLNPKYLEVQSLESNEEGGGS